MRFTPPSIYRQWWTLTERCAGRQASFDDVSWYVVPNAETLPGTNGLNGLSYGDRIVLAGANDGTAAGDLVRHEMLHAILGSGVAGHPRDMFVGRCAGVVVCVAECLTDGGPAPPVQYDLPVEAPEETRFAAGETKGLIFDFHNVASPYRYDITPGTWTFNGSYGRVPAASPPTVTVLP